MHLRKTLTLGATAVLAAGLLGPLGLTPTSQASTPTGGNIDYIEVNGNNTAGTIPVSGVFKSGTATFGGGTFGCTGGTVAGNVDRGPSTATANLAFTTLSIVCATPLGIDATISVSGGCTVTSNFLDSNVHNGAGANTDTGTGTKFSRVDGLVSSGKGTTVGTNCITVTVPGGCSAKISGSVNTYFDEALTTVGPKTYQELILNGSGLALSGQTALCFGLLTGGVTLNNIAFNLEVTGGTTTGIDFRRIPGGPIASVEVNGSGDPAADVPVNGVFKSGTASFGGGTFGCSAGTVAGTLRNGPRPVAAGARDLSYSTLSLTCATPLGLNATIALSAGCTATSDFADNLVNDGTVDTGTGPIYTRVDGSTTIGSTCVTVAVSGGCSAKVSGSVNTYFDEAITTVGGVNYQDLVLNGTGLALSNQTALCFGLLTGGITLNSITFGVQVTGGTTTGIDFRQTPVSAGGSIARIAVNGTNTAGTVAMNGVFKKGTASFGGSTFGCTGGTVAGNIDRGPVTATADFTFSTLSIVCATPLGTDATISVSPGCTVTSNFLDSNVHDGVIDTGTGAAVNRVDGLVAAGKGTTIGSNCITVTGSGGCSAKVSGSVNTYFDEALTTDGTKAYQELILNGTGLTLSNQTSFCFGLLTGGITLNDIYFNVEVTGGSTTGINFRQS